MYQVARGSAPPRAEHGAEGTLPASLTIIEGIMFMRHRRSGLPAVAACLPLLLTAARAPAVPTIRIAPGIDMPMVVVGTGSGQKGEVADAVSLWLGPAGGTGIDTAYGCAAARSPPAASPTQPFPVHVPVKHAGTAVGGVKVPCGAAGTMTKMAWPQGSPRPAPRGQVSPPPRRPPACVPFLGAPSSDRPGCRRVP